MYVRSETCLRGYSMLICIAAFTITTGIIRAATPSAGEPNLREYLAAAASTDGIFLQTDLRTRRMPESAKYPIESSIAGRVEGALAGYSPWPLMQYTEAQSAGARKGFNWPGIKKNHSFFIEFDPPVEELPDSLNRAEQSRIHARMKAFDRSGNAFAEGEATRTVRFSGFEAVRVQSGTYPECARFEIETGASFGWWCSVRLRETIWVDRVLGIVLRQERLSGRAILIATFDSTYEYERSSATIFKAADRPNRTAIPKWSRLAISLDRSAHQPRIAGLAIEYQIDPARR